jgi:hypothetical protein
MFAYKSARPWIGVYSPHNSDSVEKEWVPMSWLENGDFIGDQTEKGEKITSGADVPELAGKASLLRATLARQGKL